MYCALSGACGFLEHPAFPTWVRSHRPASTWALIVVSWLKKLHRVSIVTFDQCVFSCEGRKPTSLLLVRLPSLRDEILSRGSGGRCPHAPHFHTALQGRNPDGSFRTSLAKVYPASMNAALAESIIHFANATFDLDFCPEGVPEVVAALSRLDFVSRSVIQPDYYGNL